MATVAGPVIGRNEHEQDRTRKCERERERKRPLNPFGAVQLKSRLPNGASPVVSPPMSRLRIGLGQMNATVGDLAGNVARIVKLLEGAREQGAHLVAFPEL